MTHDSKYYYSIPNLASADFCVPRELDRTKNKKKVFVPPIGTILFLWGIVPSLLSRRLTHSKPLLVAEDDDDDDDD